MTRMTLFLVTLITVFLWDLALYVTDFKMMQVCQKLFHP